jgi:uncharacterized protein (TIGR02588 family)
VTTRDAGGESDEPQNREEGEREETRRHRRSAAEWTTLAISIIIIVGLIVLVTYVSITGGNEPPIVEARPLMAEIRHEGDSYYVPVAVTNRGGRTAEQVLIQAELNGSAESPETSEFTIDFLASGETTDGTAVFATDPVTGEVTVDVASFQSP